MTKHDMTYNPDIYSDDKTNIGSVTAFHYPGKLLVDKPMIHAVE